MFAVEDMAASGAISIAAKQIDQNMSNFVVIKVNVANLATKIQNEPNRTKMFPLLLFQLWLYYC